MHIIPETTRIINGYIRSLIYEVTTGSIMFVHIDIGKTLSKNRSFENLGQLSKTLNHSSKKEINDLVKKQHIIEVPDQFVKKFTPLNKTFLYPYSVSNLSIHVSSRNYKSILAFVKNNDLSKYLENISLYINDEITVRQSIQLLKGFQEKCALALHVNISDSKKSKIDPSIFSDFGDVYFHDVQCLIDDTYFSTKEYSSIFPKIAFGFSNYVESQNHHIYFNRRVCIDAIGNIKNAPETSVNIGNINDFMSFDQIVDTIDNNRKFKEYWNISKNKIKICADCELKFFCVSNAALVRNDKQTFSLAQECRYNPYIAKWENEDGYVPVNECGTFSKDKGFLPDRKIIAALNQRLWNV